MNIRHRQLKKEHLSTANIEYVLNQWLDAILRNHKSREILKRNLGMDQQHLQEIQY